MASAKSMGLSVFLLLQLGLFLVVSAQVVPEALPPHYHGGAQPPEIAPSPHHHHHHHHHHPHPHPPTPPPTHPPVKPPVHPPTKPPTYVPPKPPVHPPTKPPTYVPPKPPVHPPAKPPTYVPPKPPVHPPTKPPVKPPVHPPTKPPTKPPVYPPVKPPTKPPVHPPTKPPTHSPTYPPVHPPPTKPPTYPKPPRSFVAVQGVVYCKSCKYAKVDTLLGATPIAGATVKLTCKSSVVKQVVLGKTDKNGYFWLQAPKTITSYGAHKCTVSLVSSPLASCSKPSTLHDGLKGAVLRPEKPFTSNKLPFVLYSVGPFAFEPKCY